MTLRRMFGALCIVIAGCGRYDEFVLPKAGEPERGEYVWQAVRAPVLPRGPEPWDQSDALNPAVVRQGDIYFNFYSGFDGRIWHTGLAISGDGLRWSKRGRVLSPEGWEGDYIAANGCALIHQGEFFYWYQVGRLPRITLARSRDGRIWRKHGRAVLEPGPRGSWDERGVADPYLIALDGFFYLFYLGQDRAMRQRIGVARSTDGVQWTKLRSNPVLELGDYGEFDEKGLGEPAVWRAHGSYWMLYTGRDQGERRRMGLARSQDGVRWLKLKSMVIGGEEDWNAAVVCDPSVEVDGDDVHVWFGGGDRPSPDERLNGQIGYGRLRWRKDSKW
ncbi:MAG: hypothetical protein NZV14_08045 [Bryobacteraceae bacterium]|nr:hypothetical protein [Bryobacteraceae bacterium]MDW8378098.1 hypothetical protein [Bryobacterales bacterium]